MPENHFEEIFEGDDLKILIGDLNTNNNTSWDSNRTNVSGRQLFTFYEENDIQLYIPTEPTHYEATDNINMLHIGISKNVQSTLEIQFQDHKIAKKNCK